MDTLLIPAWRRPEFLWHCLSNLTKADGVKDVFTIFRIDTGADPDNLKVIWEFSDRLGPHHIAHTERSSYTLTKQSYSLLTGYIMAAKYSSFGADGLVFMVEEDIMVSRDFFRYHQAVHDQQPFLFCSLSTKNHNRHVTTTDDPEAYYLTTLDYCSLGVCFKASVIQEHIIPHVNEAYLRSPQRYVQAKFPRSILNKSMCEQDGLIRRIQENLGPDHPIAYPHQPRAFHAGFYGYNRPQATPRTFSERLTKLSDIIYSPQAMRVASLNPAMAADSEPTPLDLPEWRTLSRQQPPQLTQQFG